MCITLFCLFAAGNSCNSYTELKFHPDELYLLTSALLNETGCTGFYLSVSE